MEPSPWQTSFDYRNNQCCLLPSRPTSTKLYLWCNPKKSKVLQLALTRIKRSEDDKWASWLPYEVGCKLFGTRQYLRMNFDLPFLHAGLSWKRTRRDHYAECTLWVTILSFKWYQKLVWQDVVPGKDKFIRPTRDVTPALPTAGSIEQGEGD